MKTKVALIGSSSSGKSTCAFELNGGSDLGDMDRGLGTSPCPASEAMLAWILGAPATFVAVSVHVEDEGMGLRGIRDLKRRESDPRIGKIHFVYLSAPKWELIERTRSRPGARGGADLDEVFHGYIRDDKLFKEIADEIVTTDGKSPNAVAAIVHTIADDALLPARNLKQGDWEHRLEILRAFAFCGQLPTPLAEFYEERHVYRAVLDGAAITIRAICESFGIIDNFKKCSSHGEVAAKLSKFLSETRPRLPGVDDSDLAALHDVLFMGNRAVAHPKDGFVDHQVGRRKMAIAINVMLRTIVSSDLPALAPVIEKRAGLFEPLKLPLFPEDSKPLTDSFTVTS